MPMPHLRFLRANLKALFSGAFALRDGHLPPAGHTVPDDFAGVGVATNADPACDAAVLDALAALDLRRVRLDFTYGDEANHVARFLDSLCEAGLAVTLHLVQPAQAARAMPGASAEEEWQRFVAATLDRYGDRVAFIEAGSTINRKRWAGYTLDGFLTAWATVHDETRKRNLTLIGPSITDFEPPWTVGIFDLLAERNQLPDIHGDNLFAERATEPERWDQKILGPRAAPLLRVNFIKKARLLARLGARAGMSRLISPAAFWTLPRIERLLPDGEQKQADYLTRYFVLAAASGALEHAAWGPLVCHREGLIDDGDHPYPELERITHYAAVDGTPADFRRRPAFAALAAFNRLIPGSTYLGRLNKAPRRALFNWPNATLEVHAFQGAEHLTHVVWTTNGNAAAACDVYTDADLAAAQWLDRDGQPLREAPTLITEAPLYLRWPATCTVVIRPNADLLPGLRIHRHVPGLTHFYHRDTTWHGMVLAADQAEAQQLIAALHPDNIGEPPPKRDSLRHARNAIWTVADPRHEDRLLVVKQPVKHHLHKKLLDRLKPSKARRSWSGAAEMQRRGLTTAAPVAWFEQRDGSDLTRNWYVCEHVAQNVSAGAAFSAFARGEALPAGLEAEPLFRELAAFIRTLHDRGLYFRDLSGGNILIETPAPHAPAGSLRFKLIDTGRIHTYTRGLPRAQRLADLTRATHKLDAAGRAAFVQHYFRRPGKPLPPMVRLRFALYDHKAQFKRKLRKTAFYKRLKR